MYPICRESIKYLWLEWWMLHRDQMLHDLIVRMRIDAQVRDLCPAVIDDLGEKSVDCSV